MEIDLLDSMTDDPENGFELIETEYCDTKVGPSSSNYVMNVLMFPGEELVLHKSVIDMEWQPLGPVEILIFRNQAQKSVRFLVYSMKSIKALLVNCPITQFIPEFVRYDVQLSTIRILFVNNFVLDVPECPTHYKSDARWFIPDYKRKDALCAFKFSKDENGYNDMDQVIQTVYLAYGQVREKQFEKRLLSFRIYEHHELQRQAAEYGFECFQMEPYQSNPADIPIYVYHAYCVYCHFRIQMTMDVVHAVQDQHRQFARECGINYFARAPEEMMLGAKHIKWALTPLRSFNKMKYSSIIKPTINEKVITQPTTRITTLANGIRVASEETGIETATVGVWIDAGSRRENKVNNGTAHFLEHMAFKGTNKRSALDLELEIENMGGHLNAYTSREHTAYYAKVFKNDVGKAVDILSDILQNALYQEAAIEQERGVILREYDEVAKQLEEVAFDHLHAAAYQGTPLGMTILGPKKNIKSITRKNLIDFVKTNYIGPNIVISGAGGVRHDDLVSLTEKAFSSIPKGVSLPYAPSEYTGSEIKLRDDPTPNAHMIIAVEGPSWTSPDYFPLFVAQSIIGSWDRSMTAGINLSSPLAQIVAKTNSLQSYSAFQTAYKDTGLFGVYMVSDRRFDLDVGVFDVQQEMMHLCLKIDNPEVERAKMFLKASILSHLDGSTPICEDIGRQVLCYGKRYSIEEIFNKIDQVNAKTVKEVTSKYWYDKCPAVVGFGCIETMPDYLEIRQAMQWYRN